MHYSYAPCWFLYALVQRMVHSQNKLPAIKGLHIAAGG
jgi:hypothetical protein